MNRHRQRKMQHTIRILAVAAAAVLVGLLVLVIVFFRPMLDSFAPKETEPSKTLPNTAESAGSDAGTIPSSTEELPAKAWPIREGFDAAFEERVLSMAAGSRVIETYYQDVLDYAWEDLYVILIEHIRYTFDGYDREIAIFRTWDEKAPFLYEGYRDAEGNGTYYLYVLRGNRLYHLLTTTGRISYSYLSNAFLVEGTDKMYTYHNGVFVESPDVFGDFLTEKIEMTPVVIEGHHMTSEELPDHVQDLRKGGTP